MGRRASQVWSAVVLPEKRKKEKRRWKEKKLWVQPKPLKNLDDMPKLFGTSLLYLKAWYVELALEVWYGRIFWQVFYKTVGTMTSWLGTFAHAKFQTIALFVNTSSDFSSVFREHIAKCKNLRSISENEMPMWYFLMIHSRSLPYTYPAGNMRNKQTKIRAGSLCLVKLLTPSYSGIRRALGP